MREIIPELNGFQNLNSSVILDILEKKIGSVITFIYLTEFR